MSDLDPSFDYLEHFGVKGMRWGHHKPPEADGTRKATRQEKREHKNAFYEAKSNRIFATAMKDPNVLIKIKNHEPFPTVITGKEFISYMERGGMMDIKMTDVYAKQKTKNSAYELQAPDRYQKLKRVPTT